MSNYETYVKKNSRPYIESLRDDIAARRDKDFFWPTGTQVYCGSQGSGKTISAVKHLIDLHDRYPKAVIVSNIQFTELKEVTFKDKESLSKARGELDTLTQYIRFQDIDQLAMALTGINNGKYGVIYIIDEIHTYFNALDSKNIPMFVFTEISQQRKQRKLIVGTSQLFLRMAKPLREQCDSLIICSTVMGVFTKQTVFDGMSLSQDYDGSLSGHVKKVGWFFHRRRIRNAFDTFQKVVSSDQQYEFEGINRIQISDKKGKQLKLN
jgi:hypothetical protein